MPHTPRLKMSEMTVTLMRTSSKVRLPNATLQAPPEAGATQERRL